MRTAAISTWCSEVCVRTAAISTWCSEVCTRTAAISTGRKLPPWQRRSLGTRGLWGGSHRRKARVGCGGNRSPSPLGLSQNGYGVAPFKGPLLKDPCFF